jgi:hypothetical protein
MLSLPRLYKAATDDAAWPASGGRTHVTGGSVSNTTLSAALSPRQEQRRQECRTAVQWARKAHEAALNAQAALLGEQVQQPETIDPRATMGQAELDRLTKKQRRDLYRREGELRR